MKRVLLLGSGGFIGRAVAREAREWADLEVIPGPRRADLDLADASDREWDDLLGCQPDVVINAAGATVGDDDTLFRTNAHLVGRLIAALGRQPARPWLVQLGSAAEYGRSAPGVPVSEHALARPQSSYGMSKLTATQSVRHACESGRLRGVVLRVFNPVGAGQSAATLPGRAAALLRDAADQDAPGVAFGALDTSRDYVALRDVAGAALFAARLERSPLLLNVGSGRARASWDIVRGLARLAGYRGEVTETASPSGRSAAVPWQQADLSRIRALGWAPRFTLDEALLELWYGPSSPVPAAWSREEIRHDAMSR
ncbi:nucleoside-diphosphate-sugar epimerase [Deinococcus metalli]|uniref:Nucleoside-diphosphate-sugar epimerase n=1 Tax=Deinococcus metalli TaxID=1141878 RepID=A0A7W8NNK0_9DEIO|nr:NAD(P)-dependent oxidoreductase [Deinococcus metalli]MBB5375846.1 nucleoside-diphosphate-sugar epimerase [Deinococcus metalli]GHF36600.1 snoG protein [Deinococcus metalli]